MKLSNSLSANQIIELYNLEPLSGEGGFYRETYRSGETFLKEALPGRYSAEKSFGTAILYLLTSDTCSALHRLPDDEIYHFYLGDPVVMLQLHPDGSSGLITLGQDIFNGEQIQVTVPKGVWQGSLLKEGGSFALLGTTVAPGFDFSDFEAASREKLVEKYPGHREIIIRLTK
jgi:uncharacterized protein